jgi:GT2 family glycosyltransferase
MEFSFGLRYWDESPEAIKKYEEDFNIVSMQGNLGGSDA